MTTATPTRIGEKVQRDVLEELTWDPRLQPNEIGVAVKDGVVTLTGRVDSYIKKWAAERATYRVCGVTAVVNDIEVRPSGGAERTDADLVAEAMGVLQWDARIPTEKLEVTVSNGWIMLRGEVGCEYQKRAAERVVRRLAGVRGVTNLVVRPRLTPAAEEFRRRIEEAFVRNAEAAAERISVHVDDAKVILTGTVRSWFEKHEAERVAWSAPRITSVDNRILVTGMSVRDD
jgi:osmotically-inducible protein OsmY